MRVPQSAFSANFPIAFRHCTDGEAARRERSFERCIDSYEQAVALYRGEFMQGSYEPWVEEQRSYYREQYLRMLESLAAVAEKKQEWLRTLDLAQRILHEDPFREDIHCMVMRAQAAAGNRVAVKEQYETLRGLLQKELGVGSLQCKRSRPIATWSAIVAGSSLRTLTILGFRSAPPQADMVDICQEGIARLTSPLSSTWFC